MNHQLSQQAFEEACRYIPGGVNSPVRAFGSVGSAPVFIQSASGCRVTDRDGNSYLDYICSWGPMILGHAHETLLEGAAQAMGRGVSYGLPTYLEVEMARQIAAAYPAAEMVRMVNSGTEATMSAIRVARGFTGRDKVIKFEGCYHGHSDCLLVQSGSGALTFGVPTSPGVPADIVKNTLVCRYNDLDSVQAAVQANPGQVAAVIVEPVAANMGVVPPAPGFLQGLRQLCTREGIVLIFDEVITGFRLGYGGAAAYYGVQPDMACFGKIIGAGLPVGAYAGRREIMQMVSPSGPVYQAGTLSGNPLAMFLGLKLLRYLEGHPDVYGQLEEKARFLQQGIQKLIDQYGAPCQVNRAGSLLCLFFTKGPVCSYDDVHRCQTGLYARFFQEMLGRGVLLAPSQFEAIFLSTAHGQAELAQTLQAAQEAFAAIFG